MSATFLELNNCVFTKKICCHRHRLLSLIYSSNEAKPKILLLISLLLESTQKTVCEKVCIIMRRNHFLQVSMHVSTHYDEEKCVDTCEKWFLALFYVIFMRIFSHFSLFFT